jgi:uncharacterized protein DUF4403
MVRRYLFVVGMLFLCLSVAMWYRARDRDLSVPPPPSALQLTPQVPTSQIAVNLALPYERLAAEAESATPGEYSGSGNGDDWCTEVGPKFLGVDLSKKLCVGTQYDFHAVRGPITVGSGPNGTLRIAVPLKVSGHGGFRGSIASWVSADAKSFEASADAYADLTLGLAPDWCPQLQVKTDLSNLNARVEIVGGVWIGTADLLGSTVRDQVQKMGERGAGAIQCADVRKAVQQVWRNQSFDVALPGSPQPIFVNVEPLSVGFSGVQTGPAAATVMLNLSARVSLSDTAIPASSLSLPPAQTAPITAGSLSLTVPLRISYDGLNDRARSLWVGHPYAVATPAGEAIVTIDDVKIYPSGNKVAIATHLKAAIPHRLLATTGWAYLTARPVVNATGTAVSFQDVQFSRALDSSLIQVATALFDTEISAQLANLGRLDLTQRIADAQSTLKSELAKHSGPVSVDLGTPVMRVGRIVPGSDALYVEGLLSSGARATLVGSR